LYIYIDIYIYIYIYYYRYKPGFPQAHHTLLTVGKMDFESTIVMTYPAMMEGLLATVPVQVPSFIYYSPA